jgi:hypothetical protein
MKVDPDIGVRIDVENRLDTSYLTLRLVVVRGFLNTNLQTDLGAIRIV